MISIFANSNGLVRVAPLLGQGEGRPMDPVCARDQKLRFAQIAKVGHDGWCRTPGTVADREGVVRVNALSPVSGHLTWAAASERRGQGEDLS